MTKTQEVLTFSVALGEAMLQNGAEIFRVKETVTLILQAYELPHFDVYVLSNGIFASANEGREDACSIIRQVPLGAVNLAKISYYNQLSRDVVEGRCSIADGWKKLSEIREKRQCRPVELVVGCATGCGAFCFLQGGTVLDMSVAFGLGILIELLLIWMRKQRMVRIVTSLFASIMVALASGLLAIAGMPISVDKVVISGIIPLFPGMAFTTSIREFFNADHLSGVIHLVDALLTALCIAAGVGIGISVVRGIR